MKNGLTRRCWTLGVLALLRAGSSVAGMASTLMSSRVRVARVLAETLLHDLPDRMAHTAGVAVRAEELSGTVDPADREVLVIAAWLHDIGYSAQLHDSGLHELDGAHYLEE